MSKKQMFTLEFPVRCSPTILWEFLSTPSGLQEWFADVVNLRDGIYSFAWSGGAPDKAKLLELEEEEVIRFQWIAGDAKEFFEFKIAQTEISNQTILVVTDFADKNEVKDQSRLWEYQIKELFHRLGA